MPIYLGKEEGCEPSVVLTLTSNASLKNYPHNTNTQFTNYLAEEICGRSEEGPLLLKVKRVCIPEILIPPNNERKNYVSDIIQIRVSEIEGQIMKFAGETVAATFDVREAERTAADNYVERDNTMSMIGEGEVEDEGNITAPDHSSVFSTPLTTPRISTPKTLGGNIDQVFFAFENKEIFLDKHFTHSPILKLKAASLKKLTIELTLMSGEIVPVNEEAPPTIVEIEILPFSMNEAESTITCFSHASELSKSLYPNNTLTDFQSHLPHLIDLSDMEMCVSSITMPALYSHHNVNIILTITVHPNKDITGSPEEVSDQIKVQINSLTTKVEILEKVRAILNSAQDLNEIINFSITPNEINMLSFFYVQNKMENKYLTVSWNSAGCSIFGFPGDEKKSFTINPTSIPEDAQKRMNTRRTSHRRQIIGKLKSSEVKDLFPPDIAFLYCDVVKSTPVGDSMSQLLQIIPFSKFKQTDNHFNSVKFFSPPTPLFRSTKDTKVNKIGFKILRTDGSSIIIHKINDSTIKSCGGTSIELKFRRKPYHHLNLSGKEEKSFQAQVTEAKKFRRDWKRDLYAKTK